MESATSEVATQDSKSAPNSGIHVLRGVKIVGIIHLAVFYFAFVLCHYLPIADRHLSEWLEVIALLVFVPYSVTSAFLLVGLSSRRTSFVLPFVVVCSISVFLQAAVTTVGAIATFVDWDGVGHVVALVILVICTCLECWSLEIVYRSYDHLRSLETTDTIDCKELGAKIVGIVYLALTYLAFSLCLVLPAANHYLNRSADCFKLIALLVFVPIGATIVLLLVGIGKRRAFFLLPFFVVCSIFFVLQVAATILMVVGSAVAIVKDWYKPKYNTDVFAVLLMLPFMVIFVSLSAWSLAIVYRCFRRLRGLKPDVEVANLDDSKPENPVIAIESIYPRL